MLLFCLYHNNPWWKKGSKQTKYLTACLPQDLSHKGMLSDLQERTPRGGTFVLKIRFWCIKKTSTVDSSVLRHTSLAGRHSGVKHREELPLLLLCLPPSLSLNFHEEEKEKLGKRKVGEKKMSSSHMHVFQLTLTTYLYVAHSTTLFSTPQKQSLLSP